ncbi:AIPR family protein [Mucilaginibacter phyllosphaerae]
MTKYQFLLNILDTIVKEAPKRYTKKYPSEIVDEETLNHTRALAYIHLYLKVAFGLIDFEDREKCITDGSYDGGIDGYYINTDNKVVYFIQSKFRTTHSNFENKQLLLTDLLVMDINRVIDGETMDEAGNQYNGKILQLQREISKIEDIGRYSYQVILLGNLTNIRQSDLRKLTGGFNCIVFDFEKSYSELVFPVISGTYYNALDLSINIDLSNKNAGSKISYAVLTSKGECEITVLFIPTVELARIMSKYKNSILKYNPRSYLGHEGKKVHDSIKETILDKDTNEFALYNNGVTMLSDETYINERIGQKNKAQLIVKNPQIINGGQTSYTLSRIYEENLNGDFENIFLDKEVLIKIITLLDNNDHNKKIELINDISNATNLQTPVIHADKLSNDVLQLEIQEALFSNYGILYERKRGEFADGIFNKYLSNKDILERNLFFRMYYASNGYITKAREKKLFLNQDISFEEITKGDRLDNSYFGYCCFVRLNKAKAPNQRVDIGTYAKVRAMTILYKPVDIDDYDSVAEREFRKFDLLWPKFLNDFKNKAVNTRKKKNTKTDEIVEFQSPSYSAWYNNRSQFRDDIIEFFLSPSATQNNFI